MPELHFPWLEASILIPLAGALWVWRLGEKPAARIHTIVICALALSCAVGVWVDFAGLSVFEAHDHWDAVAWLFGTDLLVIDELSAPLLPLAALIVLVTVLSSTRAKVPKWTYTQTLLSEAILLATFSCRASWLLVVLLAVATIPPWLEMRRCGRCTRIYTLHMGVFVGLLVAGYGLLWWTGPSGEIAVVSGVLLAAAGLLRSGVAPLHCWMTDLFEKASFGTALLFVTPLTGAYAVMRLALPIAPDWALQSVAVISLFTAVYAGGMALVQRESRRFFCYLFLSHASLVLVGIELAAVTSQTGITGLTGGLCVWLSVGLSLTGFGITLRSIEMRIGRTSMVDFHGLFKQMPSLAGFFLLTGLASIGFPATIGFVGMELLVDGAVNAYPLVGTAVVIAAALNGIAMLHAYFRIFTGSRHVSTVPLHVRPAERVAVLALTLPILGVGLLPQPSVASRHHAAVALAQLRQMNQASPSPTRIASITSEENR